MATVRSLFTTAAAMASVFLSAGAVHAQTPSYEQILEGARKEGRLFVAVSSPGTPQAHAAIAKAFNERFGLNITVETRTGDTPSDRKARQRAKPPQILLTTPESLSLLLSHEDSFHLFAHLKNVIIDEIIHMKLPLVYKNMKCGISPTSPPIYRP